MNSDNFYDILGIDSSASEEEIRRAYFDKAKMLHPDSGNGDAEKFHEVRRAYAELLNPVSRASHDNALGLRRDFGNSQLREDLEQFTSRSSGSFQFRSRSQQGIFGRFVACIFAIITMRRKGRAKSPTTAAQYGGAEENCGAQAAGSIEQLTLSIYSEDSFPLQTGECLSLSVPKDMQIVQDCIECMQRSFQKYPVIEKAVLIEASLSLVPEESIFLVVLDKKIDRSWGIDSVQSVQIESYPEGLPGLLLCNAGNGPFSESIKLYGIEFYPNLISGSIN